MKRKQKRYSSEQAILDDIVKAQAKKMAFLKESEAHEAKAQDLIDMSLITGLCADDADELRWQKELAAKARRSADRIDGVIAKLRLTQDAFTTNTLPGVDVPSSVVFNP